MVKQGDIIYISFDPSLGHEQQKTRPALVVSNNSFNKISNLKWLCPISHSHYYPLHINLPSELKTDGKVLCDQIRSMDLEERPYTYIESVPDSFLLKILSILKITLDIED